MKDERNSLKFHLQIIVDSINAILKYLNGVTEQEFLSNTLLQDACLMRLVVIGEYTAKISQSFQDSHPEIEWKDIKAARNFYVHVYIQVKWDKVWETIHKHLSPLKNKLEQIIKLEE